MCEYVRCVFCLSGKEETVKAAIEKQNLGEVIIPMKEKPFRVKGVWETRTEKLMPGYLFVYSDEEIDFFRLRETYGVVRILCYENKKEEGYLRGSDRQFALMLRQKDGLMARLKAVKEGDFVRISDGALRDMRGKVVGINKGRHMVNVELEFLGEMRNIWFGYEVLEIK